MNPSGDTIDVGLRGVLLAAERLARRLDLAPLAVPAELRHLEGEVRGVPVALTTRRLAGDAFAALTVATIAESAGPLRAVTVIGTPAEGSLQPVLGVDLVGLGGALSLVAVDLAPTDRDTWLQTAASPLEQLHLAAEGHLVARKWPAFAVDVFSPRALLAGARRGHEAAALAEVASFVDSLADLYATPRRGEPPREAAARASAARWRRAERQNRREHDALRRIFGEAPAAALVELLFPS